MFYVKFPLQDTSTFMGIEPKNARLSGLFHRNVNARDEGIEPPPEVLETPVLPLYESRNNYGSIP